MPGCDHRGRGADLVAVADRHALLEVLLGLLLDPRVERGLDGQAAAVDVLGALGDRLAQRRLLLEPGDDVVAEVGVGRGGAGVLRGGDVELDLGGLGRGPLLVADQPQLVHPVQDDVAPGQGGLGEVHRVGGARALGQAGQQGGLGQGEGGGADPEVVPRGGLDAVGLVAVVGEVEVALEDLVLGQLLLEGDRVLELLQLAAVAGQPLARDGRLRGGLVVVAQGVLLQGELDVLLGQRRGALGVAAAQRWRRRARAMPWGSTPPCS